MNSVRLQNFRCFEDTGTIELKPLMFLVGANSSGKSSFLKLFPLLKQSIGRARNGVFLWNDSSNVDFKNFANTVRDNEESIIIEYEIDSLSSSNSSQPWVRRNFYREIPNIKVSIELKKIDSNFDYLSSLKIEFLDQEIKFLINQNYEVEELRINNILIKHKEELMAAPPTTSLLPRLIYINENHFDEDTSPTCRKIIGDLKIEEKKYSHKLHSFNYRYFFINNYGLNNRSGINNYLSNHYKTPRSNLTLNEYYIWFNLNKIIDAINLYFMDIADNISYIRPLRAVAQRYYRIENVSAGEISSDGTNLAMYLYNLPKPKFSSFQKWTRKNFGFTPKIVPSDGNIQLQIKAKNESSYRNLIDIGFGYSQILPILAIIWKAIEEESDIAHIPPGISEVRNNKARKIIAIEQPELHLHPCFINLFADMLGQIVSEIKKKNLNISILIETHSEVLINRMGELIASRSEIIADDVNILLFNAPKAFEGKEEVKKYVEVSKFNKAGYLENWPYGFFS